LPFSYWTDKPWFLTEGKFATVLIIPSSWGSQLGGHPARIRAKDWLLSLPRNSIDSWVKSKDAFIGKYYPPAKIIALRSDIMKFR
jgi:hypothetical protein